MSNEHWSEFWKEGHSTTFAEFYSDNYQGKIKQFWLEQMASMADNCLIHDLAAGSGAVARIIVEFSNSQNKSFQVSANDYAKLDIENNQKLKQSLQGINFFSETLSEQLPLEDRSIDLIVSQYGFEYSDMGATISEIQRLLKPKGRFVAICHFEKSNLILESIKMLEFLSRLKDEQGFFELLCEFSKEAGDILAKEDLATLKHNKDLEVLRIKINNQVESFINESPDEFVASQNMAYLQQFFQQQLVGTVASRLEFCQFVIRQNEIHSERLEEMINASYNHQKLEQLALAVGNNGQLTHKEFIDDSGNNLGLTIELVMN